MTPLRRFLSLRAFPALSLVFCAAACGSPAGTSTGSTCPTGNTVTYSSFGQAFFASYCDRCHSSGSDLPRLGSITAIRTYAGLIDEEAGAGPTRTNTAMPRGAPTPSVADRQKLSQWLVCGAP